VTYSTFDTESIDVLRLNFVPDSVFVGGRPIPRVKETHLTESTRDGYLFNEKTGALTIRHISSRDVDIHGNGDQAPPTYITFDDPHLAAGTVLAGQYPSGVIDWAKGGWEIGTPFGKFGTFTLTRTNPEAEYEEFSFYAPRVFAGIDVYNDGESEATVTIRSPEDREVAFTIKPKELRRVRTGWRDATARVMFDFRNGQGLRFDNLAYIHP
jgi:hypothetical protein